MSSLTTLTLYARRSLVVQSDPDFAERIMAVMSGLAREKCQRYMRIRVVQIHPHVMSWTRLSISQVEGIPRIEISLRQVQKGDTQPTQRISFIGSNGAAPHANELRLISNYQHIFLN